MESKKNTFRQAKSERLTCREIQVIDFLMCQNNKEIVQIDIRHYQDFQKGFIPKSVNIDFTIPEFDDILDKVFEVYGGHHNQNQNQQYIEKIVFIIDRYQLDQLKEKLIKYDADLIRGFLDFRKYNQKNLPLDQSIQFAKEGRILANKNEKLENFYIIDIRSEEEYEKNNIEHCTNIQIEDLLFKFDQYKGEFPRLHNIYIYGDKLYLVSMAISILKKHGYNNSVFINMYQLEDLLSLHGFYTPQQQTNEIIPNDLKEATQFDGNLSVEDQQNLQQQFNDEMDVQDYKDIQEINNNITTGNGSDQNGQNIHKISEDFNEDSEGGDEKQENLKIKDKVQSDEDDEEDEEDFPDFAQPIQKNNNNNNDDLKENIKSQIIENKIQENAQKPVDIPGRTLMSKRSIIHSEIQARNFRNSLTMQKIPQLKEERDMEGFDLEHILQESDVNFKKTKIICTLGPACNDVETMVKMIDAGMDILRFNFSHGTMDLYHESIEKFREAQKQRNAFHIGIMMDTKGPEIRIGKLEGDESELKLQEGQELKIINSDEQKCDSQTLSCKYKDLAKSTKVGNKVFLQEGHVVCEVIQIDEENNSLQVKVLNNGTIKHNCELYLQDGCQHISCIQEQDEDDIVNFALKHNIDFLSLSFTRSKDDIDRAREVLGPRGTHINIIAKIDNILGLSNFDEIAQAADGILVARGDLGLELSSEKVFVAQKYMTYRCNNVYEKPIICATQMLQSMIQNPRPTRAEASDVANAVLDGCDCVMLSKETSIGTFPVECVATMSNICKEAELCGKSIDRFIETRDKILKYRDFSQLESMCCNAVLMSFDMELPIIVVFTVSGEAARILSKLKPKAVIIAISDEQDTVKKLTIVNGVKCFRVPTIQGNQNQLIKSVVEKAVQEKLCTQVDQAAFIMDDNNVQNITVRDIGEEISGQVRVW